MRVTVISPTIQEFAGVRYYRCGAYFQRKGVRLHRVVWELVNGRAVPDGHHVHHVDHDRSNNQPENLRLETAAEHLERHSRLSGHGRQTVRHAIAAAPAWHASDAGAEWHRKQYAERCAPALNRPVRLSCQRCGAGFDTVAARRNTAKFCSGACKAAAHRQRAASRAGGCVLPDGAGA